MWYEIRKLMHRFGELYYLLKDELQLFNIVRDKFFVTLRANHMLIESKRRYNLTINSMHRFKKHQNIDIKPPDQVWVSYISYIGKIDKSTYLSLLTDAYSKKIMDFMSLIIIMLIAPWIH
jgi:putative transposase